MQRFFTSSGFTTALPQFRDRYVFLAAIDSKTNYQYPGGLNLNLMADPPPPIIPK